MTLHAWPGSGAVQGLPSLTLYHKCCSPKRDSLGPPGVQNSARVGGSDHKKKAWIPASIFKEQGAWEDKMPFLSHPDVESEVTVAREGLPYSTSMLSSSSQHMV